MWINSDALSRKCEITVRGAVIQELWAIDVELASLSSFWQLDFLDFWKICGVLFCVTFEAGLWSQSRKEFLVESESVKMYGL
jgi:hypothetical protein